jgi:hypothetical protein
MVFRQAALEDAVEPRNASANALFVCLFVMYSIFQASGYSEKMVEPVSRPEAGAIEPFA